MNHNGQNVKRLSLASDLLVPVGLAAMDVLWLYAIALTIATIDPGVAAPSFRLVLALPAGAAIAMRVCTMLPWRFPWNRLVLLPVSALAIACWLHLFFAPAAGWSWDGLMTGSFWLVGPHETRWVVFVSWLAGMLLWIRGLWIGLRTPSVAEASGSFLVGIVAFIALLVFVSLDARTATGALAGDLNHLTVVFFAVSLAALALVHGHWSSFAAGQRHSLSPAWLLASAVPVGGILLIGLAVTEGLTSVGQWILQGVYSVALVLWRAVLVLWSALVWATYWVNCFLHWISSLFSGNEYVADEKGAQPFTSTPDFSSPLSADYLKITALHPAIVVGGIVGALTVILIYLVLRFAPKTERPEQANDERMSQWSWTLFMAQLSDLWFALFGRMFSKAVSLEASRSGAPDEEAELAEIRRLYVRMLHWAAETGQARRSSQTPAEFARNLGLIRPVAASDIEAITAPYADARYGDKAIHGHALNAARNAVERLSGMLKSG
jgi:hypothetical protein